MEQTTRPTHPLILIAAVSVSLASLAVAAHYTGLLPARSSPVSATLAAAAVTAPAPAPLAAPAVTQAAAPAPVKKVVVKTPAPRPVVAQEARTERVRQDEGNFRRVSNSQHDDNGIDVYSARPDVRRDARNLPPPLPQRASSLCHDCGTVESVREVAVQSAVPNVGLGAIAGGVLGGLLGNQTGGGNGKKAMTVVGALGGAFAGHQVEKHLRGEKQYEVSVRFDDGSYRTFTQTSTQWRSGDRVRLANGQLAVL